MNDQQDATNSDDKPAAPSRRNQIEQLLEGDPGNTFLRYSLAMELASDGELDAGVKQLEQLLELDPPYVPAFFMSGQFLAQLDQIDESKEILSRGIDEARKQGNDHAAGEMSEFRDLLG